MTPDSPTAAFIDWWFAPWRGGGPALFDACQGELARRDAYRDWCCQAGLAPDLPRQADWRWQAAAALEPDLLLRAAALFGGLLAARAQHHAELAQLAPDARRWCLAVALTQPLAQWLPDTAQALAPARRGLAEFALRAEQAVPGLWPRLALGLAPELAPGLAQSGRPAGAHRLSERDRRCWMLCVSHARASTINDS